MDSLVHGLDHQAARPAGLVGGDVLVHHRLLRLDASVVLAERALPILALAERPGVPLIVAYPSVSIVRSSLRVSSSPLDRDSKIRSSSLNTSIVSISWLHSSQVLKDVTFWKLPDSILGLN